MRLATRLHLSIASLLIGYLATVCIGWLLSRSAERRLAHVADAGFPAAIQAQSAHSAMISQAQAYQDAVLQGERSLFSVATSESHAVQDALKGILALADLSPTVLAEAAGLVERHRSFTDEADAVYRAMSGTDVDAASRARAPALYAEMNALTADMQSLADELVANQRTRLDSTIALGRHMRNAALLAFSVLAAGSVGVSLLVVSGMTRRLGSLVHASDRLSRGEFESPLADPAQDELGALSRSFEAMRVAVHTRDHDLRALNESLEATVRSRTLELSQRNTELTREVAERQRAELSLRLLESAVTQTEDAIFIAVVPGEDRPAALAYANPAFSRLFDDDGECTSLSPDTLGDDDEARARIRALLSDATAGKASLAELRVRAAAGRGRMTEWRVAPIRDAGGNVTHVVSTLHDISARKHAEAQLKAANRALVDASRQAGQAEVATGVLHNVGNVLNSINVSATLIAERLSASKVDGLGKAVALIESRRADLAAFLHGDPRGSQVIGYLGLLAATLAGEQRELLDEAQALRRHLEHVKDVIAMQQSYARGASLIVPVRPAEVVEDALRMHTAAFDRHGVEVVRDYDDLPAVMIDQHRTLQILVNLISNAEQALATRPAGQRRIEVHLHRRNEPDRLELTVSDNGIGIPRENLARIFSHGFTTRPGGHGFGLHSSALSAKEMGGALTAYSDGPGTGASFTITIPLETRTPCQP